MYTRCRLTEQCASEYYIVSVTTHEQRRRTVADLERHEKTLAFDIREAQVNAAWVSIRVTVPHDHVNLCVQAIYKAVRQCLDVIVIDL